MCAILESITIFSRNTVVLFEVELVALLVDNVSLYESHWHKGTDFFL